MMIRIICKNSHTGQSFWQKAGSGEDKADHLQKLSHRTVLPYSKQKADGNLNCLQKLTTWTILFVTS